MPEFLSPAWFSLLDGASTDADPALRFRLEQVVTGTPTGDVRYWITVADGGVRVSRDAIAPVDATLRVSFRTAVELATGQRSASDAFQAGDVTFAGDLSRIEVATAALAGLSSVLAGVRAATTYPGGAK